MRVPALLASLLLNAFASTLASAQNRSIAYMDLTVGGNVLVKNGPFNNTYYEPGGTMALLAFGTQPALNRSFVTAIHVGVLNLIPGGDVCYFTPLGGCEQDYPLGSIIAVTVGGRPLTSPWRVLQFTAGPAYFGHYEGGASLGALAVGRFGLPPGSYVSPGLAFHGMVTTVDGNLILAGGIGVSLRTW